MTEHDLDALASDLLDGLLTAEQAADALRDPAVATRVEEMRAAQGLLRAVPPPSSDRRETAIAAALASAAPAGAPGADADGRGGHGGAPAGVGDLDAHRARAGHGRPGGRPEPPARPRRNVAPWLAAAAVILVVLAFGGLLATMQPDSDSDTGASSEVAATSAAGSAGGDASDGGQGGGEAAPTTTAPTTEDALDAPSPPAAAEGSGPATAEAALDLGAVDSVDALADRARIERLQLADADADGLASGDGTNARAVPGVGCSAPRDAVPAGATLESMATATLDGEPVTVWLYAVGDASRMLVLDGACEVVGRRTLD